MVSNLFQLTQVELEKGIIRSPLVISPQAKVIEAIALMSGIRSSCETTINESDQLFQLHLEAKSSCVLAVENDEIKGILTERDIIRLSAAQISLDSLSIEEVMISSVITLPESEFTDLFVAINLLQHFKIRHLPLVDKDNRLVGLVTHETLRQLSRPLDLLRLRRVEEVMTVDIFTANPQTSVLAIAKQMVKLKISSIVITENEIPLGIITERDLVQFQALRINMESCAVGQIMSTPVFTISAKESLLTVQTLMEKHLIRRLVVIDKEGKIRGIVTQTDILKALNPLEIFNLANCLDARVSQLESEKIALLENRAIELEEQVQERTSELEVKRKREQLIAEITNRVRNSLDLKEVLKVCVSELRAFSQCDRVLVFQFEQDWSGIITAESVAENFPVSVGNIIKDSCFQSQAQRSYMSEFPIVTNDIYSTNYNDCHIELLEHYQVKANLVVPIYIEGQLWGLLIGHQCADYRDWQLEDINLFTEIVSQLAIAIQQSLSYQQQQQAQTIIKEQFQELTQWRNRHQLATKVNQQILFEYNFANQSIIFDDNAQQILGYSSEDLPKKLDDWMKLIHPEDRKLFQREVTKSLSQKTDFYLEYRFLRGQGDYIWLQDRTTPVYDNQGQLIKAIGLLTNISDRKLAEIELQLTATRLQEAQQISKLGHWECILQPDEKIYWSEEIFKIFEIDPQEFSPSYQGFLDLVHPDDRELVNSAYWQHINNKTPYDIVHRLQTPNGRIKYVHEQCKTEYAEDGTPLYSRGTSQDITVLKETELRLQELNQELEKKVAERTQELWQLNNLQQAILNSANYSIVSVNHQGIIQTFNQGAEKMLGYKAEEVIGKFTPEVFTDPQTIQDLAINFSQELGREIKANLEAFTIKSILGMDNEFKIINIRKDGSRFWTNLSVNALKNETGEITGFVGIAKDIDKQEQAELENQRLKERLEFIISASPAAIFACKPEGDFATTFISENIRQITGYRPEQFLAEPDFWANHLHAEDIDVIFAQMSQLFLNGNHTHEYRFRHQNGNYIWILNQLRLIKDNFGNPLEIVGYFADISNYKQVELEHQQLLQELSTFKRGLDKSAIVDIASADGIITYTNDRYSEISGYTKEELIGETHRLVKSGYHSREFFQNLWHIITQGEIWQGQICNRAKNGNLYWIETSIIPFFGESGEIEKYLAISFDITERKLADVRIAKENSFRRQILDTMTDGLCVCQEIKEYPFINFTVWNPKMIEITGYTQAEINQLGWYQSLYPDPEIRYHAINRMERMRQGKNLHNEQWQIQPKHGEPKIITISTSTILDDNNQCFTLAIIQDITVRKQQERENNALKEQLEFVLASSPAVIYAINTKNFTPTFISENISKILGYSPEEFLDKTFLSLSQLLHPEHRDNICADLSQLSRREIYKVEYRIAHKNGNYLWVQIGLKLSRNRHNQSSQIVGYLIDITEQKQAQLDLESKTEEFDRFFSISLDLLCIANTDGYFLHLNPQWEKVLGYPLHQLEGSRFLDYVHPEDLDSTLQAISILKEQTEIPSFINRYRRQDGSYRWIEWKSVPVDNHIYTAAKDITEQKQSQEAIERQLATIEASINGIAIVQNDEYIYLNKAHHEIFGYKQGELMGKNWRQLYRPEDVQHIEQQIFPIIMENKAWRGEMTAKRKDGSLFDEGLSLTITDDGLIICVCENITERKQQELELQKTNAELARATRLKDEFLANMSHELRTPLNAILGMTEGLGEGVFGEPNEGQLNALATISKSANHLLGLINDILDVSKIESGKLELELLPTQLRPLCSSSLAFIKQQALTKRIQLETQLPPRLPDVLIDENRIRQVLINLLTNAIKFTLEGGKITLAISFTQDYHSYSSFAPIHWIPYKAELTPDLNLSPEYLSPPHYLLISIIDTGIGISEENITKLFQPFIQIDSALNRQYAGTGLGLVLVQRIIQLHGGQIGLSSIERQGTHFIIALPCLEIPSLSSSVTTNNVEESIPFSIEFDSDKAPLILLAEDNLANISTIYSYLKAKGYHLVIANNGKEAIAMAETEKPDLIIMDIQMPEVDGLTAIQQIRINPDLAETPIIALTALAMESDKKRCLEAGANQYMTKPVRLKQLTLTIQEMLQQKAKGNPP